MASVSEPRVLILGAGLAGLSAGYYLSGRMGHTVVIEQDAVPGGLAKTLALDEFRFDLGGHRFLTDKPAIADTLSELLGAELLSVRRKSQILSNRRWVDYPLGLANTLETVDPVTILKILGDLAAARLWRPSRKNTAGCFEDWVKTRFGQTLFDLYFRDYSEKVWGLSPKMLSADLAAQRIGRLSMGSIAQNLFVGSKSLKTLQSRFFYPRGGIGCIAEALYREIAVRNTVLLGTRVERVHHDHRSIVGVDVRDPAGRRQLEGAQFISTIPLTRLVAMLHPEPPPQILAAARALQYRDMVLVVLLLNRPQVTRQTWIYIPDKRIPFGRIHEPKNWSDCMAPREKTLLAVEYFCFADDPLWRSADGPLAQTTARFLQDLGLIRCNEVFGSSVVRIAKAYPLMRTGYQQHCAKVIDYFGGFKNLQLIGRAGRFVYHNMDQVMEAGLTAAQEVACKES